MKKTGLTAEQAQEYAWSAFLDVGLLILHCFPQREGRTFTQVDQWLVSNVKRQLTNRKSARDWEYNPLLKKQKHVPKSTKK